jgi:hypothetical protein
MFITPSSKFIKYVIYYISSLTAGAVGLEGGTIFEVEAIRVTGRGLTGTEKTEDKNRVDTKTSLQCCQLRPCIKNAFLTTGRHKNEP